MTHRTKKRLWYFSLMEINAKKLAKSTGISHRTAFRIVKGEAFPSLDNLIRIHKAYPQICLTYLFSDENIMPSMAQ